MRMTIFLLIGKWLSTPIITVMKTISPEWEKWSLSRGETMDTNSDFLMYQTENGDTKIQVRLEGETVWMTQKAMAELFQTST